MSEALERIETTRDLTAGLEWEESLAGPQNAVQRDDEPSPLTCFTVQVFGSQYPETWLESAALATKLRAAFAECEENLASLLPGFTFKIREWDELEEEDPQ